MYAIIETGGKQVRVEVGSKIYVEKLDAEVGAKITLDKVLLIGDKALKVSKVPKLQPKSKNKAKAKKSASSSTKQRLTNTRPLVIVNHILA